MAAVRHAQAKRALTLGRPVERTAGEVEFAEAYQIDMDRIAAVMERHLGRGATLPD